MSTNTPSLFGSTQTQATGSTRRHLYGVWSRDRHAWQIWPLQLECVIKVLRPVVSSGFKPPSVSIARAQGSQLHIWSLKKATWIHWLWKLAENCEPQCGASWLMINVTALPLKRQKRSAALPKGRGLKYLQRNDTANDRRRNAGLSTGFPHLQFISPVMMYA